MWTIRLALAVVLLAMPGHLAVAQEGYMGEAIGEGDEPIGGEDVGGEAVGEGDEPVGGEDVGGEAVGEGDEPVGDDTLY